MDEAFESGQKNREKSRPDQFVLSSESDLLSSRAFGGRSAMALTLVKRSGFDSLGKLEKAAIARMREAESLHQQGHRLAAVYLYGYVIEISLKTAYYRLIGLAPNTQINTLLHRRPAEDLIKRMVGLPAHLQGSTIAGHNVVGWARLIDQVRSSANSICGPFDSVFAKELDRRMQDVFNCWAEFLRYRVNRPYNVEVANVRNNARWIRRYWKKLWS